MKLSIGRTARAFTLIEVMVALFLLGMVVAAVYSSWTAVVRGARIGLEAAAEVQRSRIAMRTIEDALTSTRMFVADGEYYAFEAENGSKAFLSFAAKLSESFPRSGKFGDFAVRRVTFGLETGPDSQSQLVLRQFPLLMEPDIDEREHPVVLAKHVKKFELGFWDARAGEWIDEWTQTNQLPPMVQITLQLGAKDNDFQSKPRDEVTRVIAIPAIAVPAKWQMPGP
ncbi:MAG: prepilin-type N-terminal cleavage/methylation domain-containing protein, partial [Akkermansiaceae bacterium]|nr:prepilin-type N-terminal cleavage/methylation domain-containing protein [Verrucomicrobiales bacterium]